MSSSKLTKPTLGELNHRWAIYKLLKMQLRSKPPPNPCLHGIDENFRKAVQGEVPTTGDYKRVAILLELVESVRNAHLHDVQKIFDDYDEEFELVYGKEFYANSNISIQEIIAVKSGYNKYRSKITDIAEAFFAEEKMKDDLGGWH